MVTAIGAVISKRESLALQFASIAESLSRFEIAIPNEDSARAHVLAMLAANGVGCGNCGVVGFPGSDRYFCCHGCKRPVWVTAHTFFENVRKLRPWLALIWLMERGILFNPNQVHSLIDVSCSTAAEMKRKLDFLVAEQMPPDSPTVPSGLFNALFSRRTIETPARAHPREEQSQIDKQVETRSAPEVVPIADIDDPFYGPLNDCEKAVWDCLEEPLDFDRLAYRSKLDTSALNAGICLLEIRGLVKCSRGLYSRVCLGQYDVDTSKVPIGNFIKFVKTCHQGIGRRTLQWYLAAFWCHNDRKRWGPGELLSVCLKASPVSRQQLRMYVSAPFVKILPQLA